MEFKLAVSDLFDLSGRTALITGASRGLGQSFARALAEAGADLVITSRRVNDLMSFCHEIEELGRKALPLELDVRDQYSIERTCAAALDACDAIDILVNNAGCNIRKPALEVTWDDWNTILDTNLRGMFFVAQGIGRNMVARRYGRIINVGSYTSVAGFAGLAPYGASRGGAKQLTMSLADDWGPYGVTVNCLAPGWFKTELTRVLFETPGWADYLNERISVRRPGRPEDLEGAIVYLASEASRYLTGQTILVDGGISTGAVRVPLNH
jgi:NAD(P)-dependent dehydrogenase (short-subunit alcohol dehydrogenase family)